MAIRNTTVGDFEILFRDSSEAFILRKARMICMKEMVMFVSFDEKMNRKSVCYYPYVNIYRIKEILDEE